MKVKEACVVVFFFVLLAFGYLSMDPATASEGDVHDHSIPSHLTGSAKTRALQPAKTAAKQKVKASRGHVHVDESGKPQLMKLIQRINSKLEPYFPQNRCFKGWGPPVKQAFLPGCAIGVGCKTFESLIEAKAACDKLKNDCGGVVDQGNHYYELRMGKEWFFQLFRGMP